MRIAMCKKSTFIKLAPLDSDIKLNFWYIEKKESANIFIAVRFNETKNLTQFCTEFQKDLPLVLGGLFLTLTNLPTSRGSAM